MATVHGGGADLDRWLAAFLEVLDRNAPDLGAALSAGLARPW
jgi:hypothetical protein